MRVPIAVSALEERKGACTRGQWRDPLHHAAAGLTVRATSLGPAASDDVVSLSVVRVTQDEIQEEEERHPQGIEDKCKLGGAVQGQAQRHLGNPKQGDGPSAPAVEMDPEGATTDVLDETAADGLEEDQDVYGHADAVVGVRQASRRAHGDEAEDEDDGGEAHGEDLEIGMESCGGLSAGPAEPLLHDGCGYDEEKGHGGEDSVGRDYAVILRQGGEAVSHAFFPGKC